MTEAGVARFEALGPLVAAGQRFSSWWMNELRACAPAAWRRLLQSDDGPRLFVWRDQESVVCRLASSESVREKRFAAAQCDRSTIDGWLAEIGCQRDAVQVGAALDPELFLRRRVSLPPSEIGSLQRILAQEITYRTPFQLGDIWHGATPAEDPAPGAAIIGFCHWIISKDRAEAEIARLGLQATELDFIAAKQANGLPVSVIAFRTETPHDPPWVSRTGRTLAAALLATMLLGAFAFDRWQSVRAEGFETALSEARQDVQNGRQGPAQSLRLFALKGEPGILAVWDELSRIIPDHTFLTDIRITGNAVSLSGLSSDAARLVRTLDESRLFAGATLAGPITPDPTEHKDRFRIALKLRKAGAARAVKAGERAGS